ncbi:MAG: TOBE domain-containing protein, partial [Kiritimatiellae bacterium]|nr:TOBE domain-containing protein [Kiritimatiellia bacterium]
VGRAIVRKPKAFLFDEPLSNLDAKMRVQMRAEITKLHRRLQSTMIYVTHDQIEAMTMGDRIVVMKDGWIQQVARPLDLYNRPANQFVAGFIGSPPMNFFPGALIRRPDVLVFDEGTFQVALPGPVAERLRGHGDEPLVMGLRPEDIAERETRPDAQPTQVIQANIERVEMMGAEVYLHAHTGKNLLTARVSAACQRQVGDRAELLLDMDKAHFFSGPQGQSIV